jgi:hypothetical protein
MKEKSVRNKEVVVVAKSSASAIFEPGAEVAMNFEAGPERSP